MLEDVFKVCMDKDYNYVLIRHSYQNGTMIHPHMHDAYEWVIATHGHFRVEAEGDEVEFQLDVENTLVIHYPEGTQHGLTVLGDVLEFFVMRN